MENWSKKAALVVSVVVCAMFSFNAQADKIWTFEGSTFDLIINNEGEVSLYVNTPNKDLVSSDTRPHQFVFGGTPDEGGGHLFGPLEYPDKICEGYRVVTQGTYDTKTGNLAIEIGKKSRGKRCALDKYAGKQIIFIASDIGGKSTVINADTITENTNSDESNSWYEIIGKSCSSGEAVIRFLEYMKQNRMNYSENDVVDDKTGKVVQVSLTYKNVLAGFYGASRPDWVPDIITTIIYRGSERCQKALHLAHPELDDPPPDMSKYR